MTDKEKDNKLLKAPVNSFIKEKRIEQNISQRELAKRLNVSKSYINKIEAGISKKPNYLILLDLCKELKLNFEEQLYLFYEYNYSDRELNKIGLMESKEFVGIKGTDRINEYTTKYNDNDYIDIIKVLKGYKNNKLNEAEVIGLISAATGIMDFNMYILPNQREKYGIVNMIERK